MHGLGLLSMYGSRYKMLASVYPEHNWLPWKFYPVDKSLWEDLGTQRKFLERAGKELNVENRNDWYKVNNKDLSALGGQHLLSLYSNSLQSLFAAVYPEHEWLPWRFAGLQKDYWEKTIHQRNFLDRAGKQLKVKVQNDWYNVTDKVCVTHNSINMFVGHYFTWRRILAYKIQKFNRHYALYSLPRFPLGTLQIYTQNEPRLETHIDRYVSKYGNPHFPRKQTRIPPLPRKISWNREPK
jgi:hypothetical protein